MRLAHPAYGQLRAVTDTASVLLCDNPGLLTLEGTNTWILRASGSDEALRLVTPRQMSLEQCMEFLADDELLEVTPKTLRIRKRILDHGLRMKALSKGK